MAMLNTLKSIFYALEYKRTSSSLSTPLRWVKTPESSNKLVLLVFRLEPRSGGLRNIARIANALQESYDSELFVYVQNKSSQDAELFKEYSFDGQLIYELPTECRFYVTSSWIFGSEIESKISKGKTKWIHIIQDYDELFFPVSTKYFHAYNVRNYADIYISSGKWMNLPGNVIQLPFPIDESIYNVENKKGKDLDVLFFHKPEMPRRSAFLCEQIAQELLLRRPNLKIAFYGSGISKWVTTAKVINFGSIPTLKELSDLYRRTRVGVSVNFTNPSIIPFEQLACGCKPLSPTLDAYPEFYIDGISIAGGVSSFCDAVIHTLDQNLEESALRAIYSGFLKSGLICRKEDFVQIIQDSIKRHAD
ncbi:hypothetical protein AAFM71_18675 [Chromobacterium violaceum]|uniref:hypothetical protein n=1 Tax=Chromobacterium violaceum TaxID=536 RepID=UPI00385CE07F